MNRRASIPISQTVPMSKRQEPMHPEPFKHNQEGISKDQYLIVEAGFIHSDCPMSHTELFTSKVQVLCLFEAAIVISQTPSIF
jgi:hypothetical protein